MHKHIYPTYTKRNILFRVYTFPLYLLPILMGMTREYIVTSLFTILFSVFLFFLTLWIPKMNVIFTLKKVGNLFEECDKPKCINQSDKFTDKTVKDINLFVFYKQTLCKIKNNIFIYKYNTFYVKDNQIYYLTLDTKHEFEKYEQEKIKIKFLNFFPKNEFNVKPPAFLDLFCEHATAPFFVFQMFCGVLWCLDEYVYHSLFTIFMLILFEMGVVFQRIKTMEEFKRMNLLPIKVSKILKNSTKEILSTELKPGDIIQITKPIKIPCDLLILEGNCAVNEAMLSGESTPFSKESIKSRNKEEIFDYKRDKVHILYAGTEILKNTKLKCYVLKTGFDTLQGSLISKMISNENTVSANNKESFLFILFLLFFAVISSIYSFVQSRKLNKSNYKILLEIIIILTNVVPPELPMELTIAVNNAVQSLIRKGVFCIEPFRIPLAGKVDVCCFDKTGTLTESKLTVHKIELVSKEMIFPCKLIISSCHSLILLNDKVEGDPMELSPFEYLQIKLLDENKSKFDKSWIETIKRYPFTATLRRMTIIAFENNQYFVCVKGAPEVIKKLLKEVPLNYDRYEKYAKEGYGVLALAYKQIEKTEVSGKREFIEKGLIFVGFILYECKIKKDAFSTIQALINSNHKVIMITGDNLLTAENVSKKLKIINEEERGVEGEEIDLILEKEEFFKVKVFARANPKQKEKIIEKYKSNNQVTLMCGDGTNDVGALKTAHVGVAVLDKSNLVKQKIDTKSFQFNFMNESVETFPRKMAMLSPRGDTFSDSKKRDPILDFDKINTTLFSDTNLNTETLDENKEPVNNQSLNNSQPMNENNTSAFSNDGSILSNFINSVINESNEEVVVKPGDASVAAPFTAKNGKLESVLEVIRHGRSALVTTIQMHKILALNSLISAFTLSVLDSRGIRFSDFQMTLSGILLAFSFMFLTTSKPLREINNKKPLTKIFNNYLIISIIGQTLFHILTYLFILNYFIIEPILDEKFTVNLLNSIIFIINISQQLSTFIINYIGRPYRESITENKPLLLSLLALSFFVFMIISQLSKDFIESVEIIDLGNNKYLIGLLVLFDFLGCYFVEKVCFKYFMK